MTRPEMFLALYRGCAGSFLGARYRLSKLLDFRGLESTVARLVQIAQFERTDLHAAHFFHRMIQRKKRGA
jgi:hypothetical protein